MKVRIRTMTEDDVSALAEALGQPAHRIVGRWPRTPERRGDMFLAVVDGSPVGCVCIDEREEVPDLLRLYSFDVAPSLQSRGIGTRLIAHAEDTARERGMEGVYLDVAIDNEGARRLYERLGYIAQGEPFVASWDRLDADGRFLETHSETMLRMVKRF